MLNDLDWWISNQWETFNADYKCPYKYRVLKKTNLKEMYAVRYADDARVFTCSYKNAVRIYHAVKEYLKNELKLNVSPEKSKITNLRKRRSDYLGFEMKLVPKRKKYVVNTFVSAKSKIKIKAEIRKRVIEIQRHTISKNIHNYNSYILGIRNYYEAATHVNIDFRNVYHQTLKTLYNRLKPIAKYEVPRSPPPLYKKLFKNNYRTFTIGAISLFPLADTQWKLKTNFNQNICNYTQEGRKLVYKRLENNVTSVMKRLLELPIGNGSVEYRDNTISKYSMQKGRCGITQLFLTAEEIHCHHIVSVGDGGTDNFDNLIIIHKEVHKLIHGNNQETEKTLLKKFNLNKTQLKKLNMLRKRCNLTEIN